MTKDLTLLETEFQKKQPHLEVTSRDPETGAEGYIVVMNLPRAAHPTLGQCAKGGTRITPTVSLAEVSMLAQKMALKNAAAHLPLGGAKSGLRANPSMPGFKELYQRWVRQCRPLLAEHGGPFGGFGFDLGARPEHARWACEALGSTRSFTGKPLDLGGSDYDREGLAGLGVVVATRSFLTHQGGSLKEKRIVVQGVGAMGAAIIRFAAEEGAHIVGVSDPILEGTWSLPQGLSANTISALVNRDTAAALTALKSSGASPLPLAKVIQLPCDILFPAAVQGVITPENQGRVNATLVVEGANSPTTPDAQDALAARGVTVVPDFIANCGGIIAAFVEMTSTISGEENMRERTVVKRARADVERRISENVLTIATRSNNEGLPFHRAGKLVALERLLEH